MDVTTQTENHHDIASQEAARAVLDSTNAPVVIVYLDQNEDVWTLFNGLAVAVYGVDDTVTGDKRLTHWDWDVSRQTLRDLIDGKQVDFSPEWEDPYEDPPRKTDDQG